MLSAEYDERTGIVTTTTNGLTSAAEFDAYLEVLDAYVARSAAMHGRWLHLVDASASSVQPRSQTDYMTEIWQTKPKAENCTAYVVGSTLAKMQIQRMRGDVDKCFFPDAPSARAWLLARSHTRAAAATG